MKQQQKGLPEELSTLIRRLVINEGSIRIAGTLLYVYFRRCWKLDEELAAYYMRRYFEKYFPKPLEKHRKQLSNTNNTKGS